MVAVKYNGTNFVLVGDYKIVKGTNEIKDDDFYRLMKIKSFAARVNQRIFEVPYGFPLTKPVQPKKEADPVETPDSGDQTDDSHSEGRLSVKASLKAINASEDLDFLKKIVDTDDREKVTEAAQARIDSLNAKEKK